MNLMTFFSNIQWLLVILMTVISFIIGWLWHKPYLFGKVWVKENYPNGSPHEINVSLVFGGTTLVHFIAFAAMSAVLRGVGGLNGLLEGFLIALLWIFPVMAGTYLFANRSLKLLAIDAGLYILLFSVSGFVMGI